MKTSKKRKTVDSFLLTKTEMKKANENRHLELTKCDELSNCGSSTTDTSCDDGPCSKLLDGSRKLTFKGGSCSISVEINKDTLFGKFKGMIRFSPITGKLHLCMGPIVYGSKYSQRPLISMLIKDSSNEGLFKWYMKTGRTYQRDRFYSFLEQCPSSKKYPYADVYALPGASMTISYRDAECLKNAALEYNIEHWDIHLAKAPSECPEFLKNSFYGGELGEDDCYPEGFFKEEETCISDDCLPDDYDETKVLGKAPKKILVDKSMSSNKILIEECRAHLKRMETKKSKSSKLCKDDCSIPDIYDSALIDTVGLVYSLKLAEIVFNNAKFAPKDGKDCDYKMRVGNHPLRLQDVSEVSDDKFYLRKIQTFYCTDGNCTLSTFERMKVYFNMRPNLMDADGVIKEFCQLNLLTIRDFNRFDSSKLTNKEIDTNSIEVHSLIDLLITAIFVLCLHRDVSISCQSNDEVIQHIKKTTKEKLLPKLNQESWDKSFKEGGQNMKHVDTKNDLKEAIEFLKGELKRGLN